MSRSLILLLATSLGLLAIGAVGAADFGAASRGPGLEMPAPASQDSQVAPMLTADPCITVSEGDTFTVSIRGLNVADLLAWEIYFAYDRRIVEVVDRDVHVFLASQPGSDVFDFSDPLPNSTGLYRLAAADLGGREATETGSGIMARLTLTAKKGGLSAASIALLDFNGDGVTDLAPVLTNSRGEHIGDNNGDGLFDEAVRSGQIAVDRPCATPVPEPPVEDIVDTLPTIATPAIGHQPQPQETASPGDTPGAETPGAGQTPDPGGDSADGDATPVLHSGSDGSSSARTSGQGPPSWFIAAIAAIAGLGLVFSIVIIRSTRRSA